jgi:hypothetical protein
MPFHIVPFACSSFYVVFRASLRNLCEPLPGYRALGTHRGKHFDYGTTYQGNFELG